jgi:hypothetical protein
VPGHQLGQDLVFGLHLLLQELNPFLLLLHLAVEALLGLKGAAPFSKTSFCQGQSIVGPQAQFLTQSETGTLSKRYRLRIATLLFCGVVRSFFSHTFAALSYRPNALSISGTFVGAYGYSATMANGMVLFSGGLDGTQCRFQRGTLQSLERSVPAHRQPERCPCGTIVTL